MTTEPTPAADPKITVEMIDPQARDEYDEAFRVATRMSTPLATISDAFIARDAETNDVVGGAYIHVRHLLTPWFLAEGAPPKTMTRIADTVATHLKHIIGQVAVMNHAEAPTAESPAGLSYDVYVPTGHPPPEGFERLPVEVWRRRVC